MNFEMDVVCKQCTGNCKSNSRTSSKIGNYFELFLCVCIEILTAACQSSLKYSFKSTLLDFVSSPVSCSIMVCFPLTSACSY